MPAWMMKLGKGASLVGALSGVGQKADAGPIGDFLQRGAEKIQQMQAPKEGLSEDGKSFTAKGEVFNDLQIAMQGQHKTPVQILSNKEMSPIHKPMT